MMIVNKNIVIVKVGVGDERCGLSLRRRGYFLSSSHLTHAITITSVC
jgi:hypothetical protein